MALRTAVFPENDLKHIPENRAAKTLLYCRLKNRKCAPFLKKRLFNQDFVQAWTPFPLQPEMRIVRLANGARIGLI